MKLSLPCGMARGMQRKEAFAEGTGQPCQANALEVTRSHQASLGKQRPAAQAASLTWWGASSQSSWKGQGKRNWNDRDWKSDASHWKRKRQDEWWEGWTEEQLPRARLSPAPYPPPVELSSRDNIETADSAHLSSKQASRQEVQLTSVPEQRHHRLRAVRLQALGHQCSCVRIGAVKCSLPLRSETHGDIRKKKGKGKGKPPLDPVAEEEDDR